VEKKLDVVRIQVPSIMNVGRTRMRKASGPGLRGAANRGEYILPGKVTHGVEGGVVGGTQGGGFFGGEAGEEEGGEVGEEIGGEEGG
jgi:hypothetical protein